MHVLIANVGYQLICDLFGLAVLASNICSLAKISGVLACVLHGCQDPLNQLLYALHPPQH